MYWCKQCKKYHADKFYKHKKYKKQVEKEVEEDFKETIKEVEEDSKNEPLAHHNAHLISGLKMKIELTEKELGNIKEELKMEDVDVLSPIDRHDILKRIRKVELKSRRMNRKIDKILKILNIWSTYMERKHPYWTRNEEFLELVK